MSCKGICFRHKAQKPQAVPYGRYAAGQKRCQICDIFFHWNNLWCPCCGYRLRIHPRERRYREIFRAKERLEVTI
jgi:hypothetical protein